MKIENLRTFLPSIDFETSRQFYNDLGFQELWKNNELIIFGTPSYNFFLQKYYNKDWAENLMMQLFVSDLDEVYAIAKSLIPKYENTKIRDIFEAEYGRTFHLIGPSGELWHITESSTITQQQDELLCNEKKKSTE
jgi:hypothetical protein